MGNRSSSGKQNSLAVALLCFLGAVVAFIWLGWRGEMVYWAGGLIFAGGTLINAYRSGIGPGLGRQS